MTQDEITAEHFQLIDGAVQQVFACDWQVLERISQGLSGAALYKLQIADAFYIARLSDPNDPYQNLEREFAAMRVAADADLAPQLYHADAKTGLVLMDFVKSALFSPVAFRQAGRAAAFAHLLKKLHDGPELMPDSSVFDKVETIYKLLPADLEADELFTRGYALKQKLEPLLDDPADLKPCHCDINPTNVLWDGERFWLIDWGLASQQNKYFDLACWVNFFSFYSTDLSQSFLETYFGRSLNAKEQHKFNLMAVFVSVFYGFLFSYFASLSGERLSAEERTKLGTYGAFMSKLGSGEENLAKPSSRLKMGAIYLEKAQAEAEAISQLQS